MNAESITETSSPVKSRKDWPTSRAKRAARKLERERWGTRPESEQYARAAQIFLRLALKVYTGETIFMRVDGTPTATPSSMWDVVRELDGQSEDKFCRIPSPSPKALEIMHAMKPNPATSSFPHLNKEELIDAYFIAAQKSCICAQAESSAAFYDALSSAKQAVSRFFAGLAA